MDAGEGGGGGGGVGEGVFDVGLRFRYPDDFGSGGDFAADEFADAWVKREGLVGGTRGSWRDGWVGRLGRRKGMGI